MSLAQPNDNLIFFNQWQDSISDLINSFSKSVSQSTDAWSYDNGSGGGESRIWQGGELFDSAGVNLSSIQGDALPAAATQRRPELAGYPFHAVGVSTVSHPCNPYVPTSHANLRYFEVHTKEKHVWWFGGGFDLTPYYGFEDDCVLWHQEAKAACDPLGEDVYDQYKRACDDYFYLPHRQEARGIGGLFFDDMNQYSFDDCLSFIKRVGAAYVNAYRTILARRCHMSWGEREKQFQLYRRGRYVEFNLLYDRGTLFGLQSGGRTESILMSLPTEVNWRYNWQPESGTDEARLYTDFLPVKDWLPASVLCE